MRFVRKVVWITGASSGNGAALAQAFAREGARLILSSRRPEELERTRQSCERADEHRVLPLDHTQSTTFPAAGADSTRRGGAIDVLINNAGVSQHGLAMETTDEVERTLMEVNYFGPIALSKAVLPAMRARRSGHVVVVSSVMGRRQAPPRHHGGNGSRHRRRGRAIYYRPHMFADFTAVTIDGVRVNVTDFDGITRRVPHHVVASNVADQIEVTKALRPDQDADSIGGAANIRTRSAFSRGERSASLKAAATYSGLLDDYSGNSPYDNPGYEGAATFNDFLGATRTFGLAIEAKWRNRAFVRQRNSTTGWNDTAGYRLGTATTPTLLQSYVMDAYVLQHCFDDIQNYGANASLEWRPSGHLTDLP